MPTVKDVDARLDTHEAVCAERWRETILRIKRLENVSVTVAGAIIMLLIGIILKVN
jgi:predicted nucleic acid-binding Zn ribbon protein